MRDEELRRLIRDGEIGKARREIARLGWAPKIRLVNERRGFATNSSSSHSVIYAKAPTRSATNVTYGDREERPTLGFGWEKFILTDRLSKIGYLAAIMANHYRDLRLGPKEILALVRSVIGQEYTDEEILDSYIDHQSAPDAPRPRLVAQGMHPIWELIKKVVVDDDSVMIVGGNDNERWDDRPAGDTHSLFYGLFDVESMDREHRFYIQDRVSGHFTVFNRANGTKRRVVAGDAPAPKVSAVPELVDLKITNYCDVGCSYCVAPDTLVLTSDHVWKPISQINPGDGLVSFNEYPEAGAKQRRLRPAVVEKRWSVRKNAIRITTDRGEIVCSTDHRFVMKHLGCRWLKASDLKLGHKICLGKEPWPGCPDITSRHYMIGYLRGMTEGDGTARWEPLAGATKKPEDPRRQVWWRVALKDADGLARIVQCLDGLGINHVGIKPFSRNPNPNYSPMDKVEIRSSSELSKLKALLFSEPPDSQNYRAGFLAGAFDSEGSYSQGVLRISQIKPNTFVSTCMNYLASMGFSSVREIHGLRITGGVWEAMRFFGMTLPAIKRHLSEWSGISAHHRPATVVKLESLGETDLIDIQTSTKTFYANGFASHNCYQNSTTKGKHASADTLASLAYNLGHWGVLEVAIGGGDPTLHPGFAEFLEKLKHYGVVPNFSTQKWEWLKDPYITKAVRENCGAVALSTQDTAHIEPWLRAAKEVEFRPSFHFVLGLNPLAQLKAFLDEVLACRSIMEDHLLLPMPNIVLLAYKQVGRAARKPPHDYTGWWNIVKDWTKTRQGEGLEASLAVDTFLVDDVAQNFTADEVPPVLYERGDGRFSCYYDAVDGYWSAHSFVPKGDGRIPGTVYDAKAAWAKISGIPAEPKPDY